MDKKKIAHFLSAYLVPVGTTIQLTEALVIPKIEVQLIKDIPHSELIRNSGIDVGVCTKVGSHKITYGQSLNN